MDRLAKIGPWGEALPRPPAALAEIPPFKKAVVLGATGSVGREMGKKVLLRGVHTRAVSRSLATLRRNFAQGSVDFHAGDMTNPQAVMAATEGCDMIFLCVGLPLAAYERHVEIARNVSLATAHHKSRCLSV